MDKKYITLEEGLKSVGPRAFSALIKPVGSVCNLNCTYCYYIDKMRFYGEKQPVMSDEMLEKFIKDYIQTNDAPEINFVWHGGEPLLAGIDFFRKAMDLQQKYNTAELKKKITNSLQTNGTLLNDEWCKFFRKNHFLVGISIDGPRDIHNAYRKNKTGLDSFDRVMKGLALLRKHNVDFNTLSVVNNLSESRGAEIYDFFKSLGVHYMQFLPCMDYISEEEFFGNRAVIVSPMTVDDAATEHVHKAPWSVSAVGYGQFLNDIFDKWVIQDVGSVFVQLFDMTLCSWCNVAPPLCAYRETCGDVLAVEHNGDVYSCDHFVYPEHRLGNFNTGSMVDMLNSQEGMKFGLNKRNTLSRECLRCRFYFACKGECPKHRHESTLDGEKKFSLCEGIKMYYSHTEPYMKYMRDLLMQEKPPSLVMPWARIAMGK